MKKTKYVFLLFVPYAIWSHSNRKNVYSFKQLPKILNFFLKDVAMGEILILYGEMHNSDKTFQWLYIK